MALLEGARRARPQEYQAVAAVAKEGPDIRMDHTGRMGITRATEALVRLDPSEVAEGQEEPQTAMGEQDLGRMGLALVAAAVVVLMDQ